MLADEELLNQAISIVNKRLSILPDFEIYQSSLKQLEYILSIVQGVEKDKSLLDKIIIGHFAVREFEETDPELSKILKKCQSIALKLEME